MNLQQLYDLRVLWRSSPNKVVQKETALAVLEECIRLKTSSDARNGALEARKHKTGVIPFPGGDAS